MDLLDIFCLMYSESLYILYFFVIFKNSIMLKYIHSNRRSYNFFIKYLCKGKKGFKNKFEYQKKRKTNTIKLLNKKAIDDTLKIYTEKYILLPSVMFILTYSNILNVIVLKICHSTAVNLHMSSISLHIYCLKLFLALQTVLLV